MYVYNTKLLYTPVILLLISVPSGEDTWRGGKRHETEKCDENK